jgi:DNA polymerase III alpha subunit (gram-positive type)
MKRQKVIFDVETTGLDPEHDEILQFSAINENGKVLLNTYIKPTHHSEWNDAKSVNRISPDMVADCKVIQEILPDIQAIFDNCSELIAYNFDFDFAFLINAGIKFKPDIVISDPMIDFAKIYGEWNIYYNNYTYKKLTIAASYYGYNFDELAHDSLEDVKATLVVYNALKKKLPPYEWMSTQLLNEEKEVIFESDDVAEVINKANELYGKCESDMINRRRKNGLNYDYFIQ